MSPIISGLFAKKKFVTVSYVSYAEIFKCCLLFGDDVQLNIVKYKLNDRVQKLL